MEFDYKNISEEKVKEEILKVLNKENNCVEFINIPAECFQNILDTISELENNDDLNTNGWNCDYWYTCKYKGENFNISGCAWYGTASISNE